MPLQEYVGCKKELYNKLIEFIDKNSDSIDTDFDSLLKKQIEPIKENLNELKLLLNLILYISDNHYQTPQFNLKIEQIISYISNELKQSLSSTNLFDLFKNNKRILLYLIKNQIITIDESISSFVLNDPLLCHFFYPENKKFIKMDERKKIEDELISIDSNILTNFDEKRQIGQNDSILCNIIRQDSIEEFIEYVNKNQLPFNYSIKQSIFETNLFLLKKEPTMIEYSAFFGSIQIFKYLQTNNVELKPSLWFYAIHSKSEELIHVLEENNVKPDDETYEKCFIESIKCHHNDIANYIKTKHLNDLNEKIIDNVLHFQNYFYFPDNFNDSDSFFLLCKYEYNNLVNLYIESKKDEIEREINIDFL